MQRSYEAGAQLASSHEEKQQSVLGNAAGGSAAKLGSEPASWRRRFDAAHPRCVACSKLACFVGGRLLSPPCERLLSPTKRVGRERRRRPYTSLSRSAFSAIGYCSLTSMVK